MALDVCAREGAPTIIVGDTDQVDHITGVLLETDRHVAQLIERVPGRPDHRIRIPRRTSPHVSELVIVVRLVNGVPVRAQLSRAGVHLEPLRELDKAELRDVALRLTAGPWFRAGDDPA